MSITPVRPRQRIAVCAALVLAAAFAGVARAQTVPVTINAASTMSTMPPQGLGVNIGIYDGNLINSSLAPMLKAAGITCVRLPGGSSSDQYDWQNNTGIGGQYVNSNDTFDNMMNYDVIPAGAKALVTVNYGSNPANNGGGDPNLAAAWVAYANNTKNYGITYWEIGNEEYGNGYLSGWNWEYDLHFLDQTQADRVGQPALSPSTYGANAIQFINAMKAQSPNIKCGLHIQPFAPASWDQQLLQAAGSEADFLIIHWYPSEPTTTILSASTQIVPTIQALESQLTSTVGATKASQMQIAITETGADTSTGAPVSLFTADNALTWLENGAVTVDYWYLNDLVQANMTPGHAYYGTQMASLLANVGDTFLNCSYNNGNLRVHATKRQDGKIGVMLVNLSPSSSLTAAVNISGVTLSSSGTEYQFGAANFSGSNDYPSSGPSTSTVSGLGNSFNITVPAYTIINLLIPISSCSPTAITPYLQVGSGAWVQAANTNVAVGATLTFGPQPITGGSWSWTGPNGFTSTSRQVSLSNMQTTQAGTYTATYVNTCGSDSTQNFVITVGGVNGGPVANGTYQIDNLGSGKCLEVFNGSTTAGALIDQYTYYGGAWQQWTLTYQSGGWYKIIGVASGESLDIAGASSANGASVDIWPYSGNSNQQFTLTATGGGYYRITPSNATGSCVEVNANSTANNALVQIWSYMGSSGQQWKFSSK